nr:hypothetical protein [Tanacetum cinerariifolium]
MATTIDQQVALDKALVPSTQRLRIGRSNFRLPSDIQSKESTLQVVYDVLRSLPFLDETELIGITLGMMYCSLQSRTMATTIDQQVALDEALVPSTQRLRIGRSNFRLPSDIQSKESTLQVVYDVLRNSPFFRAFQVTADVPEIYMQEFWATPKLHHNSIRFKMDTKKSVLDLEAFREMLHISPRIPSQSFAELPSEEEILEFLRYLGHSHEIRHLTDVNVNKLYQPWRSFASVINKCLTGKSSSIDSFRLSQEQILWGFYHRINVDYAYIIWEDFVYQPSISRRNKINWHYVRDDVLFSTIKVVSRHQTTQQYGAILPIELTTDDIRNSKAYKEYYAYATGEAAPKPKASARKKKGDSAFSTTPPTPTPTTTVVSAPRLSAAAKGTGSRPGVPDVPSDDSEEELSWNSSDNEEGDEQTKDREEREGDKTDESNDGSDNDNDDDNDETGGDEGSQSEGESDEEETRQEEEESFDPIPRTPEGSEDERNDEEDQELRLSEEARIQEEEEADELYHNVNINHDAGVESIFTTASFSIVSLQTPTPIMTPSTIATITTSSDAPIPPTTIPSIILENLPTFNSAFRFDERLRSLETTFSEYRQTNPFVDAVSAIPVEAYDADKAILDTYRESTILKRRREDDDQEGPFAGSDRGSKRLREGGEHASASTPSEIATGSAGRSTTWSQSRQLSASEYAFAEEPMQTTCQMEEPSHSMFEIGADDQPIVQTSQHPEWFSQPRRPPLPDRDWNKILPATQGDAQSWISDLARQTNVRSSFNEIFDTPIDFSNFIMNRLGVATLTPELLAG